MKNVLTKAQKYIALNEQQASGSKLTTAEIQQCRQLRRELAARGLDPQHITGLEYRALVFTHKAKVATFVSLRPGDKRTVPTYLFLKKAGIEPDQQRLARLLAEFKQNAKRVDKQKTERFSEFSRSHRLTDLTEADFDELDYSLDELGDELSVSRDDSNSVDYDDINAFAAEAFNV